MTARHSSDGRSQDHDDRRGEREGHRPSEPEVQETLAGRDGSRGFAPSADQRTVPATPAELVALQSFTGACPSLQEQAARVRVAEGLALLRAQQLNPWECQQVALALLQQLESYHQSVVAEMHDASQSTPAQVACWAIDGDRLMHCRRLLESITLI